MEIVLVWFVLSFAVAWWAASRGRGALLWFFVSLLASPLIGFVLVAVIGPNAKAVEQEALETGDMRKCPFCAELVRREAVKCKHCGSELQAEPAPAE